MPTADSQTLTNSTAHTSTAEPADLADDDDAEYASSGKPATTVDGTEYKIVGEGEILAIIGK